MGKAADLAYRPVGWAAGATAGALAGVVFKQVWRVAGRQTDAPSARDRQRGWAEILMAAALQGAIFGLVKAAVDRGSATAVERATGYWPH